MNMKNAIVILKSEGNVLMTHSAESSVGEPSNDVGDLKNYSRKAIYSKERP